MKKMMQCDVRTNKYDHQVIMYFISCTHYRTAQWYKTENPAFQDIYKTDSLWWDNHLRHTTMENMTTMRKIDTSYK